MSNISVFISSINLSLFDRAEFSQYTDALNEYCLTRLKAIGVPGAGMARAGLLGVKGLPCAPSMLSKLATIGGGPKFRKFSRNVVYLPSELDEWICSRLSGPKSSTCDQCQPDQGKA